MGFFDKDNKPTKEEIAREMGRLQGENELLKSQVTFLKEQLKEFQDALMAKDSPQMYQLSKEMDYMKENPAPDSSNKEYLEDRSVMNQLLNMQEGSMFPAVEDLHDLRSKFTSGVGAPESDPIQNNDES